MTRNKAQKRERHGLFNLGHIFEAPIEPLGQHRKAAATSQAEEQANQQVFDGSGGYRGPRQALLYDGGGVGLQSRGDARRRETRGDFLMQRSVNVQIATQ